MEKKILFLMAALFLTGCDLFRKIDRSPRHKTGMHGTFIGEGGNNYYLFTRLRCDSVPPEVGRDTLTLNGRLYYHVFVAEIIRSKLDKDFRDMDFSPCGNAHEIYAKGDTVRKQVPGFGQREFLVVENVVGVL